jgi:hypothetical protein
MFPSHHPGWHTQVTVFSCEGGSARLIAGAATFSVGWLPYKASEVRPGHVEAIGRYALAAGWDPTKRGPDFQIDDFAPIICEILFPLDEFNLFIKYCFLAFIYPGTNTRYPLVSTDPINIPVLLSRPVVSR